MIGPGLCLPLGSKIISFKPLAWYYNKWQYVCAGEFKLIARQNIKKKRPWEFEKVEELNDEEANQQA